MCDNVINLFYCIYSHIDWSTYLCRLGNRKSG